MKVFRLLDGFFTVLAGLGLVLGGLITGCAGGADGGGATQTGTVAISLTDAPIVADFSAVNVTVNQVILLSDNQSPVTIFNGARTVNLLDLEEVEDLFIIHDAVQAGTYSKIRLQVSNPEFVRTNGEHISSDMIELVAGGKIDLVPQGVFTISPGEILNIRLDLDLEKSIVIHPTSPNTYFLRPVIFVDITRDLKKRLVRVSGEIVQINQDTQSFLLRRTDPHFNDLGNEDEDRPHLVRVVVPEGARIFNASGLPDHFIGSFDSLQVGQHVHVRGLLSIEGVLHIEASLIEIGDQFDRLRGTVTSGLDSQNRFGFCPDPYPCSDITHPSIQVQVYDETLILGQLEVGRRAIIDGVQDGTNLFHAAVIVVKPDLTSREGIIIEPGPDSETRNFNLILTLPCDLFRPCLAIPTQIIKVHAVPEAVIILVSLTKDDLLQIEPIPFKLLRVGNEAHVFGQFIDPVSFNALEVIAFSTQPIP